MTSAILAAALTLFERHGFRRTSMADIAREAGVARASLYLRFSDKRSLFETLAADLVGRSLAAADAAWSEQAEFGANLGATMLAKDRIFFRMINATPHGAELLEVDAALTARHVAHLDERFRGLLARHALMAAQRGADLSLFGGSEGFAGFATVSAAGLKHEIRDDTAYQIAVAQLGRVLARAVGLR